MIKKSTLAMAASLLLYMGTTAVFAENAPDNQIQIQTSNPAQNFDNIKPNTAFHGQLEQMKEMQTRMQKSMDNAFNDPIFKQSRFNIDNLSIPDIDNSDYPKIKYFKKDNNYITQFIIPGINKKNIKIELKNNILTVSGNEEKTSQTTDNNNNINNSSSSYTNSFTRAIKMPDDADTSKITTDYKNGVLTITTPQKPESESKTTIIPID